MDKFDCTVLDFVNSNYDAALANDSLFGVATPQEGYGIMAERFLTVTSSMRGAKKTVADALEMLAEDPQSFVKACDRVYAAALQVADAAVRMAMQSGSHRAGINGGWRYSPHAGR